MWRVFSLKKIPLNSYFYINKKKCILFFWLDLECSLGLEVTPGNLLVSSCEIFSSGYSHHVYSEFHHCSWISQSAPPTTFTPTSRGKLTFLELCQVQIIIYSPRLYTALTAEEERRGEWERQSAEPGEPSFTLPRLCLHRQRGQSHNLISSSVNNMEPSETVLMPEHIKMKWKTVDENTRKERV